MEPVPSPFSTSPPIIYDYKHNDNLYAAFRNFFFYIHRHTGVWPCIMNFFITRWNLVPAYFFPATPVVAKVIKLFTVFGAISPNKPIIILPTGWLSIMMSRYTWSVTRNVLAWNGIRFSSFFFLILARFLCRWYATIIKLLCWRKKRDEYINNELKK